MKQTTLCSLAVMVVLGTAQAATVITEPFSTAAPDSTTPAGWTSTYPAASAIVTLGGVKYQSIYRNNNVGGSAAIYYTGSQGDVVNGRILDFNAEIVMRLGTTTAQGQTLRGVVVRAQSLDTSAPGSAEFWGYSVGLIATGASRGLYIYENPTGTTTQDYGTLLGFTAFSADLTSNVDYTFRVSAVGSLLEASVLTLDGTSLLASVTYDQAVETAGYFGLRSAAANSIVSTYYRDLSLTVTAVPEPSLAWMALLGVGFVVWQRRHKLQG